MIHFVAYDTPVSQGSHTAVVSKTTGRAFVKAQGEAKLKTWRDCVKSAAREAIDLNPAGFPLEGPVLLAATFTLYKPKNRPKTRVSWPEGKRDDIDKLLRAVMDACTAAGVWTDDGQVIEIVRAHKSYPLEPWERTTADLSLGPGPGGMLHLTGTRMDVLNTPGVVVRAAALSELGGLYGQV